MIWRLEYENAHGDVARLDIQKGDATPVEIIEGTENPFLLSYELEGKNKKGFIMSSFADISIYETPTFNIDDLKTSNETELSVKWYINSILTWSGFVVPDFFSREIGEPAIVNLAASDRLSALKDSTLAGLAGYINMKDLLEACLAKTGLALPLDFTVDFKTKFNGSTIDFMYVVASAERLQDDKGKRISCYDILRSILVLSNSTIRQRNGSWTLINKIQHEAASPQLTFNEVYVGAKRTIQPVFSSVGAFQEFGGGDRYPKNYDFKVATGWTPKNGFSYVRENREILGYTMSNGFVFTPFYGAATNNYQLFNEAEFSHLSPTLDTSPYLESPKKQIPYDSRTIEIEVSLTATGPVDFFGYKKGVVNFAIIAESNTETLILNRDGAFVPISNNSDNVQGLNFFSYGTEINKKATQSATYKGKLTVDTDTSEFKVSVRIYGGAANHPTFIDSISYKFKSDEDVGKGMLYRTEQIGVFSKKNDPETTIFGDYLTNGLNGYFYPYSIEDTSILRSPVDTELLSRLWTTATDPASGELPILQHVARQNSRMFGVAHNILSAVIDANTFDPLAVVSNCADEKYVVVAATFDFLRSTVEVELQQIAYGTLERRDFIYNYFGGEDDGIRSIGAASSAGGTSIGGGGSFLDKYFTFDEDNDALIANVNLVSEKELAAHFRSGDLPSILDDLPVASAVTLGGIKVDGFGLKMVGEFLRIDGDTFNFDNYYTKTSIDAFFAGTTAKTGYNKSNWDAAYGWGNHASAGYLTSFTETDPTVGSHIKSITTTNISNWNTAYTDRFKWNGGSTGLVAATGRASLGLTDAVLGTGSAGQISFWNGSGSQTGSSNLVWDNASKLLSLPNGGGGRGVAINNSGIRFVSSSEGGWAMSLRSYDSAGAPMKPLIGVHGDADSHIYTYIGGSGYNDAAIYAHPNNTVSIGKNSVTAGYLLDVNGAIRAEGNIYATGEVTAYTASDKRLKTNIKKFGNALSIIDKLTPVTYNWNAKAVDLNGNKDMTGVNYGLIAQEVEKIAPHLIRPIYEKYKTYDDRGLMTIMLKAIKELKEEIDTLKNK